MHLNITDCRGSFFKRRLNIFWSIEDMTTWYIWKIFSRTHTFEWKNFSDDRNSSRRTFCRKSRHLENVILGLFWNFLWVVMKTQFHCRIFFFWKEIWSFPTHWNIQAHLFSSILNFFQNWNFDFWKKIFKKSDFSWLFSKSINHYGMVNRVSRVSIYIKWMSSYM